MKVVRGAVAALLVAALAGCSAPPADDVARVAHPRTSKVLLPQPVPIPEGVVASGPLVGADGAAWGDAVVRRTDGGFRIELPEHTLSVPTRAIAISDRPVSTEECGADEVSQVSWDPASIPVPNFDDDWFSGDPSFIDTVLVVDRADFPGAGGPGAECSMPILAVAALQWTIAPTRPWLRIADSGAADGAKGIVTHRDGVPVLYETAPGDAWDAIAERFGITGDDLEWLNPIRLGNFERGVAYAWQVLNLDPLNRGDSETRRPR